MNKSKKITKRQFDIKGAFIILGTKRIHIIHVLLIFVFIYFVWHSMDKTFENNEIKKNGRMIIGVIDDTRTVGGKGKRHCSYHFITENNRYEGFINDDFLNVGDSIEIMFLANDPTKNRPTKFFKK